VSPEPAAPKPSLQLNLSPFFALNGSDVSYLLFSLILCPSVCGACLVGAGSIVASWLGEPEWSDLGAPPFFARPPLEDVVDLLGTLEEYSSSCCICLRF
jgi:hypothetical protein